MYLLLMYASKYIFFKDHYCKKSVRNDKDDLRTRSHLTTTMSFLSVFSFPQVWTVTLTTKEPTHFKSCTDDIKSRQACTGPKCCENYRVAKIFLIFVNKNLIIFIQSQKNQLVAGVLVEFFDCNVDQQKTHIFIIKWSNLVN